MNLKNRELSLNTQTAEGGLTAIWAGRSLCRIAEGGLTAIRAGRSLYRVAEGGLTAVWAGRSLCRVAEGGLTAVWAGRSLCRVGHKVNAGHTTQHCSQKTEFSGIPLEEFPDPIVTFSVGSE